MNNPEDQPDIVKDVWKPIRTDEYVAVRARLIWRTDIKTPIAEEVRVDQQHTDEYHLFTKLRPEYLKSLSNKVRRIRRGSTPDALKKFASSRPRDANGHFIKL